MKNSPTSTETEPNKALIVNPYEVAFNMMKRAKPRLRQKVLQLKDSDKEPDKECLAFIKAVIALAEQDDK